MIEPSLTVGLVPRIAADWRQNTISPVPLHKENLALVYYVRSEGACLGY